MDDCIFCKIANRQVDSNIVYEDDKVLAFKDIDPQAPVHVLVIPKSHIASLNEINDSNSEITGYISAVIPKIAKKLNIDKSGYRVIINCGKDGGQAVAHLHYHVLGGRNLSWPPG